MKILNVFLLAVVLLSVASCDIDDDSTNFHYEILEITEVDMPEQFEYGEVYTVEFTYIRPSDCHFYEGFDFQKTDKTERTVYAIGGVIEDTDCKELPEETTAKASFEFEVRYKDPYTFKFYTGKDEAGENQYLIIEVPVGDTETPEAPETQTTNTSQKTYYN